jgi:polyvinyl alcohol dehydrogenase (cytochrome)
MATDGKYVYAANSDQIYGLDRRDSTIKASPGLYALDIATGKVIWKAPSPDCGGKAGCLASNSAAPTVVPGVVFAGGLDGHIRAYSSSDGSILWDFDTAKGYGDVNGTKAQGGAIDGPSPVVADGMLYINSGYGMFGQMQGNVIMAFSVKK